MGDINMDKLTDKPDYIIQVSFVLVGNLNDEDMPKELALQRKVRNTAEDKGRFKIKDFEFKHRDLKAAHLYEPNEDED